MKKKLAVAFMLLFALAFAFGALTTTISAGPSCAPVDWPCWLECDDHVCMECCPSPTGPKCTPMIFGSC